MKSLTLRPKDGHLGAVSLALRDDLSSKEWEAVGHQLGAISRGHQWWIGDWMGFGERKYGETYTRAAEITGLEYQTLRNIAWVTSRFDPSRRRDTLSFSHHAEVAALSMEEQDRWLDAAEREKWGKRALRDAIQERPARQLPPEVEELNQALASAVERAVNTGWESQRAFAEDVFGSASQQGTVSRLITGVHRPNIATVNKLAELAGIPLSAAGLRDPEVISMIAVQRAARSALEALDRGEVDEARAVLRRLVGEGYAR